ncbi:ABC transporter permease [Corynebacterium diphtheriae]|uniref:ABC transporter permease n=1 Tax=Corynebacterium diphtheriae TaxID=1717 RepID=UPI0013C90F59|nr:ABC transporter permease [Corynebacterium diphtheriae]CAB0511875.1 multidrug ABC transporter permease [Corynebacterium diphtheriae]CAB0601782.1 multidrug ABC transporter permease [Corynebacterium diphtheriae]CAB0651150.1 multidrug ABC transporter permease [Corynebacterium diphtheriae]CAB0751664.1 multidrug ABC transporter permease [Corynebacterium diphtheriae]CAB0994858.1 multidrug ABC transporter permease [Corynebacterium diphtheriae]
MPKLNEPYQSTVSRFPAGIFEPHPVQASILKMLTSQGRIEAKLFLRHGEQILLSFVIPVISIVAISFLHIVDEPTPLLMTLPVMLTMASLSSGFTGQAISLAFDRRYGALQRVGASGVPSWTIVLGKVIGVLTVSILQVLLISCIAFALGWRVTPSAYFCGMAVFFLGVATFTALGLLMGGTLSSELVLGLANLIWFGLIGIVSFVVFRNGSESSTWMSIVPSVAVGKGMSLAFAGIVPIKECVILLFWLVLGALGATRWFKFNS